MADQRLDRPFICQIQSRNFSVVGSMIEIRKRSPHKKGNIGKKREILPRVLRRA